MMIARALRPLLLLFLAAPLAAQQKGMSIVDLINVPSVSGAQLAPDGRSVLYVRAEADWKQNRRISHIWRVDVATGESLQLTNGERGESSPRWSPDGRRVAFLARRGAEGEESQVWLLNPAGGEARQLTRHPTSPSDIEWAPDGSALYFVAAEEKAAEEKARERARDDVYAMDENFQQRHLWKVGVADGKSTRVTSGDFSVLGYAVSRDGGRIALSRGPNPLLGSRDLSELYVMKADGSGAVRITENRTSEEMLALSPDNAWLLFGAGSNEAFEPYYNAKLFLAPAAGGQARMLMPDFPHEVTGARWSKDGKSVYFSANMGVHSQLWRVEVASGKRERLTSGDHALGGWEFDPATGVHVFSLSTATNPGDLWLLRPGARAPAPLTRVFDYLAAEFRLPRQERVEWKGADGVTVEGILYYPLDYEQGKRYPLVVQTHGGPQASDKFGWPGTSSYVPVLNKLGYAVLKPNYRGSTGYGDAFLRDMVGNYFRNAHLDVMAGVDHLIASGVADPDRLVKMGWSGGGHMTNKIITFTDRFKAASSGAGAANWVSMVAQSDVRTHRYNWFGGSPWDEKSAIEHYWRSSPLSEAWKVKTPTLFLVGGNDVRVPPPQSVEMWRALQHNGVPTRLYIAPREPHGWQELRHVLFKANVELDWFEKHAMGRTYTWEKPPAEAREEPRVTAGSR